MVVNVADFNDEIPFFDFSSYRTDVCSSTAANETIMQIAATDRDSGSNAELTYSIAVSRAGEREGMWGREGEGERGGEGGICIIFLVTRFQWLVSVQDGAAGLLGVWPTTGLLYLTRDVEPQEVGSEVTVTVVARDSGSPSLSGSTQVVVRLLNCTAEPLR